MNMGDVLMDTQFYKVLGFSLFLSVVAQTTQAAAIKDTQKPIISAVVTDKQTAMEKALAQKSSIKDKRGDYTLVSNDDQLKVLTSIKTAPAQNFLAEQHQRFSRFVQALFQPHTS